MAMELSMGALDGVRGMVVYPSAFRIADPLRVLNEKARLELEKHLQTHKCAKESEGPA